MINNFRRGETILRKLSSDYTIHTIEGQQQIQEPRKQDERFTYNLLDPNTGVFDKWRLYKTHHFVSVADNLTLMNKDRNVCLAAQTSLDRLYSLTETLEQWSGPVSIGKNVQRLIPAYNQYNCFDLQI